MKTMILRQAIGLAFGIQALGFTPFIVTQTCSDAATDPPWVRHTVDDSSRGADGVRTGDLNLDGRVDLVTGWEEGGVIRVYLQPESGQIKGKWPKITVGKVASPEDALLCDLDGDGVQDVVSCCEGRNRAVFVHWAPDPSKLTDENEWKTEELPLPDQQQWMFAVAGQLDGRHGPDLVLGSKNARATVTLAIAPEDARDLSRWRFVPLISAGWIMSIILQDLDGDGDNDVLLTDRRGGNRGVHRLENPGAADVADANQWTLHSIGGQDREVMFADSATDPSNGQSWIVTATRGNQVIGFCQEESGSWQEFRVPNPYEIPHGKAVAIGDINLDGSIDVVHTTNTAGDRTSPGVCWFDWQAALDSGHPEPVAISDRRGVKFDLIQLIDLDQDGDLDVLTCEESDNLGVFWYENPAR